MTELNQTINSDVSVSCPKCGAMFSSQARYSNELIGMYLKHWEELHD